MNAPGDRAESEAATLVLEGVLRTRAGDNPGRCLMTVNHPHRDHLDPADRSRANVHGFPDKEGHFAIALPSPPFVDQAVLTVTGGPEGDTTLFHAVVGIGSGHEIQVLAPDELRKAAIRGRLLVPGNPVQGGDMVLRNAAGRPLSVQWGFSGVELQVNLRRLRVDFDRVVGPVRLFLQDDPGLHWEQEFETVSALREALEIGVQVDVRDVVLEFDAAGHQVETLRLGSCRNDDFAKDHGVSGARANVRLAPGRYFFELVCDGGSAHGVGSFAFDGSSTSLRLECDAWEPGAATVDVVVRGSGSRGVADAAVRLRRRSESGDTLPTVLHEQVTDDSGLARLSGLAAGVYDLEVGHPGYARQAMRIRVADASEPQIAEVTMQQGSTVLLELVQPRGQMAIRSSGVAYRPVGRAWWTSVDTGPGMDLVAEGVPIGEVEFLAVAEGCAGVTSCAVGTGDGGRAAIPIEQMHSRSVRLVDASGTPARDVSATLELPGDNGDWPIQPWPIDADGRVTFFALGVAGEKFVVRRHGRALMALDPLVVPAEISIGAATPQGR
ncbi:MAG: hypothetical protein AB7O97_05835 [Planctomycetota bacterium]